MRECLHGELSHLMISSRFMETWLKLSCAISVALGTTAAQHRCAQELGIACMQSRACQAGAWMVIRSKTQLFIRPQGELFKADVGQPHMFLLCMDHREKYFCRLDSHEQATPTDAL